MGVTLSYFTEHEIDLLNRLQFKSEEKPYFDPLRHCLRWRDEESSDIAGISYERLLDLVIVRSYIHMGKPRDEWYSIAPTAYFVEVWEEALRRAPDWPGFKRLELSSNDRSYFLAEIAKPLLHIVYSGNEIFLSKTQYESWREIQDAYESYKTSLGPWSAIEVVEYLSAEYTTLQPIAKEQVRHFLASDSDVCQLTFQDHHGAA